MAYCNKCQTENLDNAKFCRECGAKITDSFGGKVNTIVCIECDHLNPIDTKFCEQCGAKIIVNAETKLKSVLVSAILEDHAWTEDAMNQINEGLNSGMMKSEAKQIFLEAEKRKNSLMKILKDSLKKTKDKDLIKLINDRIKDNEGELKAIKEQIEKNEDNSFACPYCKREIDVKGGIQDKEMEIECELCHKKFKCITGVAKIIRGKTNARVQYGPEPISITLKQGNREMVVNFKTTFRFLVNKGDRISIIYLKKFLSKSFNEIPSLIFNWSSEDVYKVGVSLF